MKTRTQAFCRHCQQSRLFTREVEQTNHGMHLVVVLLCCGLWLPIWILLSLFPKTYPWLCASCGQELGAPTPDEAAAAARVRDERKAERRQKRAETLSAAGGTFATAAQAAADRVRRLVGRVDAGFLAFAGHARGLATTYEVLVVLVLGVTAWIVAGLTLLSGAG